MFIVTNLGQLPQISSGSVITMGDFDGLHSGHRVLIDETIRCAKAEGLTSILITYEPSPKKILKKLATDSRLTTFDEKKALLAQTELDYAIFYPVTIDTLKISARTFLRGFLLKDLRMRYLVMGNDHHFGHNRRGNTAYLTAAKDRYGFHLQIIAEQMTHDRRTSSSRMRLALAEGDAPAVTEILGRPYSVSGEVVTGDRRGHLLGFPTANLALNPEKLLPAAGVYYGQAILADGRQFPAVANLGKKPTAGLNPLGLEIHLLDFSENIYGQVLVFEFHGRIRPEQKFADFAALKAQITADIGYARQKFLSLI